MSRVRVASAVAALGLCVGGAVGAAISAGASTATPNSAGTSTGVLNSFGAHGRVVFRRCECTSCCPDRRNRARRWEPLFQGRGHVR